MFCRCDAKNDTRDYGPKLWTVFPTMYSTVLRFPPTYFVFLRPFEDHCCHRASCKCQQRFSARLSGADMFISVIASQIPKGVCVRGEPAGRDFAPRPSFEWSIKTARKRFPSLGLSLGLQAAAAITVLLCSQQQLTANGREWEWTG